MTGGRGLLPHNPDVLDQLREALAARPLDEPIEASMRAVMNAILGAEEYAPEEKRELILLRAELDTGPREGPASPTSRCPSCSCTGRRTVSCRRPTPSRSPGAPGVRRSSGHLPVGATALVAGVGALAGVKLDAFALFFLLLGLAMVVVPLLRFASRPR